MNPKRKLEFEEAVEKAKQTLDKYPAREAELFLFDAMQLLTLKGWTVDQISEVRQEIRQQALGLK